MDPVVLSTTPAEDVTCGEQNRFFDMRSRRPATGGSQMSVAKLEVYQ